MDCSIPALTKIPSSLMCEASENGHKLRLKGWMPFWYI